MSALITANLVRTLAMASNPATAIAFGGLLIAAAVAKKISDSGSIETVEVAGLKASFRKQGE